MSRDNTSPRSPASIRMSPTTCTFRPWVEVVATVNRKIPPAAISVTPAPMLTIPRPPGGWAELFTGAPSRAAAGCGRCSRGC